MINKPSLSRLSRKAGVKSMSEDSYSQINDFIEEKLNEVLQNIIIINTEKNTKTIMPEDIYAGLQLSGYNITSSSDLSTTTCSK